MWLFIGNMMDIVKGVGTPQLGALIEPTCNFPNALIVFDDFLISQHESSNHSWFSIEGCNNDF